MHSQAHAFESSVPHTESPEDLIRVHLAPLLRFIGFFTRNDEESLGVVQDALRQVILDGATHSAGLYKATCDELRACADWRSDLVTMERTGGLSLLLKDLAGLRYAEIADVLGLDTAQVRVHIASARAALLPAV